MFTRFSQANTPYSMASVQARQTSGIASPVKSSLNIRFGMQDNPADGFFSSDNSSRRDAQGFRIPEVPSRSSDRKNGAEEWEGVEDTAERRKIQNKYAQRRFREKVKREKEEAELGAKNQRMAKESAEAQSDFWESRTFTLPSKHGTPTTHSKIFLGPFWADTGTYGRNEEEIK